MLEYSIITIQIIFLIAALAMNSFVFAQVSSFEQKVMLLLAQSLLLLNVGNALFLMNETFAGAMIGMNIMYMGAGFVSYCYLLLFASICKQEIRTIFKLFMALANIFYVTVGFFDNKLHLLYKDVQITRRGPINLYNFQFGWLFYVYLLWLGGYCLHAFFFTRRCKRQNPVMFKHLHKALVEFTICGCIAVIPYFISLFLRTRIIIASWSCTIAGLLFLFTIYHRHLYPVRQNSQEIVLNGLNDMILVVNKDQSYEYANELMLITCPELRSLPYNIKLSGISPLLDKLMSGADGDELSIGGSLYNRMTLNVRGGNEDAGFIYWFRDVTKERLYIHKIMQLKDEAERANAAKTNFLAHVSHEIRTPINAVLGMDELILRETAEEETREHADQIMRAGRTLLALINDILDSSKIEAGKMEIITDTYDFGRMMDDIIMMTKFRAESKKLLLKQSIAADMPLMLIGDETRVKQVITNIVTNAVKYTEEGSVSISVDYRKITDDSLDLLIDVADTGIGIAEKDMPKLFGSFERIENKTTHSTEGTGLGMNIVVNLLTLMRGTLTVDSKVGVGSCFHIMLPQGISSTDSHRPYTAPNARILIVDDNIPNLTIATELLKPTQIKTDRAKSGADFLAAIQKKHYDIIFLDQRMPGMDGLEAFRASLRQDHKCKDTPIVMMTADAGSDMRSFYKQQGLADYIAKPLIPEAYEKMIADLLPPEKVNYI